MIKVSNKALEVVSGFVKLNDVKIFQNKGIESSLNIFIPRLNGKEFDYQSFARSLRSVLDHFVMSRKQIKKYLEAEDYMELSKQARDRFRNIYVNRGELGELVLYTLLEGNLLAPKILSKMSLKSSKNMYVNGADGIHFLKIDDDTYHLIYGESKMYSSFASAFKDACKSISEFTANNKEFELGLIDSQLENEILDVRDVELISSILYPTKNNNRYKVTDAFSIFIGFNINIPREQLFLTDVEFEDWLKEFINTELTKHIPKIEKYIEDYKLLGKSFYIYIMPFTNIEATRKSVLEEILK